MKTNVNTSKAPLAIGPYSQAIVMDKFVYTSGQIHSTPDGRLLVGTIEEQTHQVMNNLAAILRAAGASFSDVVKTTVYMTDMSYFKKMNDVYTSYMIQPYPARETVAVKELPMGANIEISMVAIKP